MIVQVSGIEPSCREAGDDSMHGMCNSAKETFQPPLSSIVQFASAGPISAFMHHLISQLPDLE